ncbi:Beta-barrel assembly-enhancing protease [bacterium HR09]|nr:Beta-barrel assembly-enhancing protease [bacterium HR09]
MILEAADALVFEDHKRQGEALTKALALFPDSGYLLYRLALLYRLEDRPEKAIPLAKKLIRQGWRPDFSPTWELLAHCQLQADQAKDALETCSEGQQRFPTRYRHWLYAAFAYHRLGEESQARATLEEALRKYLDYSTAPRLTAYQFGQYWASLLRWEEKRRELWQQVLAEAERLLKEDPNDSEALQAKGDALTALGKPEEALAVLSTLAQSEGAGAYTFIGLARTHAALGNREKAHQALAQAEKLWREGSEVARGTLAYNIAAAWAVMGEREKATLWLARSKDLYGFDRLDLRLDPDFDPLRQAGLLRQFETPR